MFSVAFWTYGAAKVYVAAHSARSVLLKNMLALDRPRSRLQRLESNFEIIMYKIECEMEGSTISRLPDEVVAAESSVVAAETGY